MLGDELENQNDEDMVLESTILLKNNSVASPQATKIHGGNMETTKCLGIQKQVR